MRPCLVPEAGFIDFAPGIEYLKHSKTRVYIKLKKEQGQIIRLFTGERTLAEILHHQMETTGSTQFRRILSLLLLLHQNGLLVSSGQTLRGLNFCIFHQKNALSRIADWLRPLFAFDLHIVRSAFDSTPLRAMARAVISAPGILVLTLMAVANNFFPGAHRGIDLSGILAYADQPGTAGLRTYLLSMAVLWLSGGVVLSLKNLLTSYAMAALNCDVIRPRIRFLAGLVFYDCDPSDIVSAGKPAVIRLYALRILLPFALLATISLLSSLGLGGLFLPLLKQACILIAVISILPLANTDMNKALGILTSGTTDFGQNLAFLRKRYFAQFLSLKRKAVQGLDFSHIMVVSTAIWLFVALVMFQMHLVTKSKYILDHLNADMTWGAMLMLTQIVIIIAPFLVLLAMTVYIALSNVQVFFRFPVRQLKFIAQSIARQEIPSGEEVVSFLREIPLFAHLEDDKLEKLCGYMRLVKFGSQETPILQGEKGDAFFILVSGMVAVEVEDEYGRTQIVDTLTTGHSFGEIALIDNVPRTATVRTITPVSCFVLDRRHFLKFARDWAGGKDKITDIIRTSRLLMGSPLFSHLPPSQMRILISRFERKTYDAGAVVFRQDEPAEGMYLIREGKIEVRREEKGKPVFTKSIGGGELLGEIALVKSIPRTAGAVAAEKSVLLFLHKTDFYDVMQHSLMTEVEFNKLAEHRLGELRAKTSGRR